MAGELYARLARMSDVDATECLNGVLKGFAVRHPEYERLFASQSDLSRTVELVVGDLRKEDIRVEALAMGASPQIVRAILVEMVAVPEHAMSIEAWLDSARPKLFEPVTTMIVAAGIVFLLQSHIDIHYENVGGEKKLKVSFAKKPTSEGLLKKIFTLGR